MTFDVHSVASQSNQSLTKADFQHLIAELREQNLDTIRFATYRAACKLRFIQKRVNLHLVDIWNIIESFRENGLNSIDYGAEVKISRVELLLSTVYHNLNKRLPAGQQVDTDKSIGLLLGFLLGAYDRDETGKMRVFSLKVALATMCAGKLVDKLRYVFSQISDSSGVMDGQRLVEYLRQVLALPTAVFEGPTFGFTDASAKQCFPPGAKVTVNVFLDTIINDPSPACLMWLSLLHRMASVEHVYHPVACDSCGRDSFNGFRYKCQRCTGYQLCQDCFWRGRTSGSHTNQHEMKEYSSYKSPAKQLSHSIGKSLRCAPRHATRAPPTFPEQPDRTLDLANVVPATPSLLHNSHMAAELGTQFMDDSSMHSMGSQSPAQQYLMADATELDDEHKLIARYSAKLAGRTSYPGFGQLSFGSVDNNLNQRALIARLEQRNKEIMREIEQIQAQQAAAPLSHPDLQESGLSSELSTLRQRKHELEGRMQSLQDTRRDLMVQLEHLMRVLKSQTPLDGSPRSPSSLSGVGGQIRSAFRDSTQPAATGGSLGRRKLLPAGAAPAGTLQGDLLSAADCITSSMSTLVQQFGQPDAPNDAHGNGVDEPL